MLSVIMLSIIMLSVIMLSVIMLSVIMLSVIMLSAVLVIVEASYKQVNDCFFMWYFPFRKRATLQQLFLDQSLKQNGIL